MSHHKRSQPQNNKNTTTVKHQADENVLLPALSITHSVVRQLERAKISPKKGGHSKNSKMPAEISVSNIHECNNLVIKQLPNKPKNEANSNVSSFKGQSSPDKEVRKTKNDTINKNKNVGLHIIRNQQSEKSEKKHTLSSTKSLPIIKKANDILVKVSEFSDDNGIDNDSDATISNATESLEDPVQRLRPDTSLNELNKAAVVRSNSVNAAYDSKYVSTSAIQNKEKSLNGLFVTPSPIPRAKSSLIIPNGSKEDVWSRLSRPKSRVLPPPLPKLDALQREIISKTKRNKTMKPTVIDLSIDAQRVVPSPRPPLTPFGRQVFSRLRSNVIDSNSVYETESFSPRDLPDTKWVDFGIDDYLKSPLNPEIDYDSDSDFINWDIEVAPPATIVEKLDLPELDEFSLPSTGCFKRKYSISPDPRLSPVKQTEKKSLQNPSHSEGKESMQQVGLKGKKLMPLEQSSSRSLAMQIFRLYKYCTFLNGKHRQFCSVKNVSISSIHSPSVK